MRELNRIESDQVNGGLISALVNVVTGVIANAIYNSFSSSSSGSSSFRMDADGSVELDCGGENLEVDLSAGKFKCG